MSRLSDDIQDVINQIGKLQAKVNEKGWNLDFERIQILLEQKVMDSKMLEDHEENIDD